MSLYPASAANAIVLYFVIGMGLLGVILMARDIWKYWRKK